jgi:hypothetical protein
VEQSALRNWNLEGYLGAAVRILEARNTSLDVGNLQHNRSYGFNAALAPPEAKWGFGQ